MFIFYCKLINLHVGFCITTHTDTLHLHHTTPHHTEHHSVSIMNECAVNKLTLLLQMNIYGSRIDIR